MDLIPLDQGEFLMTDPALSNNAPDPEKSEMSDAALPDRSAEKPDRSEEKQEKGKKEGAETKASPELSVVPDTNPLEEASFTPEYTNPHSRREIRCEQAKLQNCIEKPKNPDALIQQLNQLAEKLDRNPDNPVAGKIKDKAGETRVLSGPLLDCALELKHVRKLLALAVNTIEAAHYEKPGKETAVINTGYGRGDTILSHHALDDVRWYKTRLMSEFHEATHEFPRHSDQLQAERIQEYPSLYKEKERSWTRPSYVSPGKKMKSFFTWPLRATTAAVSYPFRNAYEYFKGSAPEEEQKVTKAQQLRDTFSEPNHQKQFDAQYEILESIKGKPVARARYALILAGRSMDSIRKTLAGLYYSDTEKSSDLSNPQKGAPVSRYKLTAEVARKKHAFVISTKGVQGIEKLPENKPRPVRLQDTLMFNTAVRTAVENTLYDTVASSIDKDALQQTLKDLKKGNINEVELLREGNEISVLVPVGDSVERFFLGYTVKEEGFTKLITPNLKGLQKVHKTDDLGLEDVVLQYVDADKKGNKRPELMVLQSDRITSITEGEPQEAIDGCPVSAPLSVSYHSIDYSPTHSGFARSFGGTRVKTEFFRKAAKAIDDLKVALDTSRFKKQRIPREYMMS